jgi:hypothetical protein
VKACRWNGYRYFHDWQELESDQQAFLIAAYLSDVWVEANKEDAQIKEMKKK